MVIATKIVYLVNDVMITEVEIGSFFVKLIIFFYQQILVINFYQHVSERDSNLQLSSFFLPPSESYISTSYIVIIDSIQIIVIIDSIQFYSYADCIQ